MQVSTFDYFCVSFS